MAVLGTVTGLVLVLRYDPLTGLGLRPDPAAAAQTRTTGQAAGPATGPGGTTVLGRTAKTIYGSVQVEVTVKDRRMVAARAVRTPEDGGRTGRRINDRAMPVLSAETVRAQSADIDSVSGATYSSEGYRQSLQSAIDAAHLA